MSAAFSILDVIPHGRNMCLLDKLIDHTDTGLRAAVCIGPDSRFFQGDSVPAYVGIEYMGQAVAAYAGVQARLHDEPVKIGFLVSARKYQSNCAGFPLGAELTVTVEQIAEAVEGLSVFSCRIEGENPEGENIEVRANLNVFAPDDVQAYFEQNG